jgi:hypothetical protein
MKVQIGAEEAQQNGRFFALVARIGVDFEALLSKTKREPVAVPVFESMQERQIRH